MQKSNVPDYNLAAMAQHYNTQLIRPFVAEINAKREVGHPLHIYDLSNPKDLVALQKEGYGVSVVPINGALADLKDPCADPTVMDWVKHHIWHHSIDYKGSVMDPVSDNTELSNLVGDHTVQRGICVVGSNVSDDTFEVHTYGNEGLRPWHFDGITLVTTGFNFTDNTIDRGTTRLVYMPSNADLIYVFDHKTGHYAPHVIAVMEIDLPYGTNDEELRSPDREHNKQAGGIVRTASNKVIASLDPTAGTIAKVIGETKTTGIIRDLQSIVDRDRELNDILDDGLGC